MTYKHVMGTIQTYAINNFSPNRLPHLTHKYLATLNCISNRASSC